MASATNEDESRIWNVINTLKGGPDTNSPNEAMIHKGRSITLNRRKADIFASHYARSSRHNFTKLSLIFLTNTTEGNPIFGIKNVSALSSFPL